MGKHAIIPSNSIGTRKSGGTKYVRFGTKNQHSLLIFGTEIEIGFKVRKTKKANGTESKSRWFQTS